MKAAIKTILLLTLVTLLSLFTWQDTKLEQPAPQRLLLTYQTSSTRTSTVTKVCPAGVSRSNLYTQTDVSASASYRSSVNSAIGVDGNVLLGKLANSDTKGGLNLITSNLMGIVIFILSFAVGLVVFLWIWPFLCCCCCCPGCCPSKCCQKPQDEQYSKCQLYWPMVTLVLALLLTIASSIYGFVNCSNIGPMFNNMACSVAIFTDDLLNGNVTLNGSYFFVGLNQFNSQITNLNSNLTNIANNFSSLQNTNPLMSAATTSISQTLTDIQNIPGSTLSYASPINSFSPIPTDTSTFNSILGTSTTSSSLVYILYQAVKAIEDFVNGIKSSATTFTGQIGTINSAVSSIQNTLNGIINSVTSADNNLGSILSNFNSPGQYGSMGIQVFFGVVIGFSCLALLGALLTVCCDKYGCRHLMYFSCLFLFIGALVGFFISTLFSVLVPFFTWTCSYLDYTILSSANFQANLGTILGTTTTSQIAVCMPFGDGNIINSVAGSAANGLNNLTSVISGLGSYSADSYVTNLTSSLSSVVTLISAYAKGQISDLSLTSDFSILQKIADPTQYSSCTDSNFAADSWVPSINQWTNYTNVVSCKATNGKSGTGSASCGSGSLGVSSTCSGCMDTTLIFNTYSSAFTLSTQLTARYGSNAGCSGFVSDMSNLWFNYYHVKNTNLGPADTSTVGSGVLKRTLAVQAQITNNATNTGVYYNLYQIQGVFTTITNSMSSISSLTNPKYGLLAGLNCKVFGEDFQALENVICGTFYKNIYLLRLTVGIASYGILFAMCCIVCTGVRHFKHSERKGKIGDAFNNDMESKGDLRTKQLAK